MSTHGKYRLRTWLRGHLPALIAYQIPKGAQDCGCHEWYRRDDDWADCYHCEVGERRLANRLDPPPRVVLNLDGRQLADALIRGGRRPGDEEADE